MQTLLSRPVVAAAPASSRRCVATQARVARGTAPLPSRRNVVARVAAVVPPSPPPATADDRFARKPDGSYDLSAPPPFSLSDLRNAIPAHCFEKNPWRSMAYLALDVAIVAGLAYVAFTINSWWAWPAYWFAQGTMFWALFVVGHDCGHQSFSNNKTLNDFVGHMAHSSILVPYHGWRISHRTHHANHGHVENDESWHPMTKSMMEASNQLTLLGRLLFPAPLFAYPFYLFKRSPGKEGSHFDPACDLFNESEKGQVQTTNAFLIGFLAILGACTVKLGVVSMFNLYFVPYWCFVVWLDVVTYLHHHGASDKNEKVPWYRGEEWSYLRGGLSTIDRDYGFINKIHHDIGTHVVHHLFPQIPHYKLEEATEAVKPVMGPYYREPEKAPFGIPVHLVAPLVRSFNNDHYVPDSGDVVFYERSERLPTLIKSD